MANEKILVVDDDTNICELLRLYLTKEGYQVTTANDGEEGLEKFNQLKPDMVLLDVMMPRMDGLEVCRRLRADGRTAPILMLTARADEVDTVVGLDAGADDYVTKPFSQRELVARIRAVLRRGQDAELLPEVIEAGDVRMDVERHEVTLRGEVVKLALKEFELLEMLLRNAGRVMTRGQLIDRIWGSDYVGDTKTLDVHVKRLRSKIEDDPTQPVRLVTVRGLGYKYEG